MRHKLSGRQLSGTVPTATRCCATWPHRSCVTRPIRTTLPRRRNCGGVVEPLIIARQEGHRGQSRVAFSALPRYGGRDQAVRDVGPRFKSRPGGYTRILHMMPPRVIRADGADAAG